MLVYKAGLSLYILLAFFFACSLRDMYAASVGSVYYLGYLFCLLLTNLTRQNTELLQGLHVCSLGYLFASYYLSMEIFRVTIHIHETLRLTYSLEARFYIL